MRSKEKVHSEKIASFNPNENGLMHNGIFGLPFTLQESELVLLPIPWEATVSYNAGTARGPETIHRASKQIDLHDSFFPDGWRHGIAMEKIPRKIHTQSNLTRKKVKHYLKKYSQGIIDKKLLQEINQDCLIQKNQIKKEATKWLKRDKIVGLIGGDHSVSLGLIEALAERGEKFGILHIDAHADLRNAYEGMTYSHASVFFNALKLTAVNKLVQAGTRDYCEQEKKLIEKEKKRITVFTDREIRKTLFHGQSYLQICKKIINQLPANIYISFDIDGLMPWLCPNTGTPVPGGFDFGEIVFLLEQISAAGKKIIGFDLTEVAPGKKTDNDWDGIVGARILYLLCMLALKRKKDKSTH